MLGHIGSARSTVHLGWLEARVSTLNCEKHVWTAASRRSHRIRTGSRWWRRRCSLAVATLALAACRTVRRAGNQDSVSRRLPPHLLCLDPAQFIHERQTSRWQQWLLRFLASCHHQGNWLDISGPGGASWRLRRSKRGSEYHAGGFGQPSQHPPPLLLVVKALGQESLTAQYSMSGRHSHPVLMAVGSPDGKRCMARIFCPTWICAWTSDSLLSKAIAATATHNVIMSRPIFSREQMFEGK